MPNTAQLCAWLHSDGDKRTRSCIYHAFDHVSVRTTPCVLAPVSLTVSLCLVAADGGTPGPCVPESCANNACLPWRKHTHLILVYNQVVIRLTFVGAICVPAEDAARAQNALQESNGTALRETGKLKDRDANIIVCVMLRQETGAGAHVHQPPFEYWAGRNRATAHKLRDFSQQVCTTAWPYIFQTSVPISI